ncbi:MAG: trypsin-like peptidase domain-containing protein [Firmicutes bacterium]|nr:trypsin-like peptidase domain-containing protein [Bacillota bacterium]
MMEHENERMNYSFESMDNSNGSEGYRQSSYDGSYRPNQEQDHNSNKKKNGIGGRMIALLVAVALVASIGGSALTSVINSISRKNEEANAKAAETMSSQTVEPAQDAQDGAQDTQSENSSYALEKSQLPTSLSSNDTGKSLTPKEVYAMNVNACVGIATQITTNVWGQVASASASGSGFILTSDGYVVTNNHVVEGATSVTVKLYNGDEYDAEIVGTDEMNDVALLKIDATGLQTVTIGDSDQIEVGEEVIAIGNPLGELTFTMTAGVVSALDREINTDGKPINMLQTDVAINSGNSGGPLFDMNGNVIGITSAKYSGSTSSGASIEGISFAIPINDALRVIYDLQQYGHVTGRAYLGVTVKDLDSSTGATYGLPTGPMIRTVEEGGCAEKAGLQEGDIIIGFNGSEISSYTDLVAALNKCRAGDTATIKVYRAGAEVEASVTLDERPTDDVITERENAAQNEQNQQSQDQQGQPGSGSDSSNGYSYGYGNMNPFEFFQQIPGFGN